MTQSIRSGKSVKDPARYGQTCQSSRPDELIAEKTPFG